MRLLILSIIFLASYNAYSAGFSAGDSFNSIYLEGDLRLTCSENGRSEVSYVNCTKYFLVPAEFDYFEAKSINADRVELACEQVDGTIRKKSSKFNSNKGRSTKRFNLWINTLFQHSLFDFGKNKVKYTLKKNDEVVEEGNFEVDVKLTEKRRCPHGVYYSNSIQDCRSSANLCYQYFRDYNWCK